MTVSYPDNSIKLRNEICLNINQLNIPQYPLCLLLIPRQFFFWCFCAHIPSIFISRHQKPVFHWRLIDKMHFVNEQQVFGRCWKIVCQRENRQTLMNKMRWNMIPWKHNSDALDMVLKASFVNQHLSLPIISNLSETLVTQNVINH